MKAHEHKFVVEIKPSEETAVLLKLLQRELDETFNEAKELATDEDLESIIDNFLNGHKAKMLIKIITGEIKRGGFDISVTGDAMR